MEITSKANPQVKRIRSLKTRKGREREGAFWVEGIQPSLEALEAGWPVEAVVWSPGLLTSGRALEAVEGHPQAVRVCPDVFRHLSDRDGPQGVGIVGRIRTTPLEVVEAEKGMVIAVEGAQDPGNVGSIVRTGMCAGAGSVVLIGPSADPFDPHALRASTGALFSVPITRGLGAGDFAAWAERHGVRVVGTSARGAEDYRQADYGGRLALLFGSEQRGLSSELRTAADVLVAIPTTGTRSLNLAAAVAVVAFAAASARGG